MSNIIIASITSATSPCITRFAWQYDYGQILKIEGIDLPFAYEVHFTNRETGGTTITQIGGADGVTIPDEFLISGDDVYAFLFLHTGTEDGETVYKIIIPVRDRSEPSDLEPTPVQQDAITQAIAALDAAVEQTAADVQTTNENVRLAGLAQAGAEAAQTAAGSARDTAQGYRDAAQQAAANAAGSAESAHADAQSASSSAGAAAASAESAYNDAERAEQAAANAGYMFFYINENGDLIYQRTSNTQVDFYLHEGDLYVKAVN